MVFRGLPRRASNAAKLLGSAGEAFFRSALFDVDHEVANAAIRLALMLFGSILVLQVISGIPDPHHCGALVRHGAWPPYTRPPVDAAVAYEQLQVLEQEGREPLTARPFDKWEPAGCRMHEYSREDIHDCLGSQRLLFVGDSTMRVLFFAALTRLDHETAEWLLRTTFTERNPRHDISIEAESVQLDFIWDPWLNSTAFKTEMNSLLGDDIPLAGRPGQLDADTEADDFKSPPRPAMMVVGLPGLWAARNAGDAYFEAFRTAADYVATAIDNFVRPPTPENAPPNDYIFIVPVTIPNYELLSPDRSVALLPGRIQRMNNYLNGLAPAVQSHILTAYNDMTYGVPEAYEETGLHVTAAVAERWIDIPLNARCNGPLAELRSSSEDAASFAYKTTCCVAYPKLVRGQTVLWYSLLAVVGVSFTIPFFTHRSFWSSLFSFSLLSAAVLYCYIADRTHKFAQAERHSNGDRLFFIFVVAAALFMFARRPVGQRDTLTFESGCDISDLDLNKRHTPEIEFLSRKISNEWKGLMQAALLLLAYHNALDTPFAVKWTRFFAEAYVFLSTYGHTSYFLRSADFSFGRVASVLFRLNALPCLLSLMLDGQESGTSHSVIHLYYFPRLVSFWFLITFATMWVGSRTNDSLPALLLLRMCLSAAVVSLIMLRPGPYGFPETVGRINAQWDADSMRRAISLSWCASFLGMAAAVIARRAALIRERMEELHAKNPMRQASTTTRTDPTQVMLHQQQLVRKLLQRPVQQPAFEDDNDGVISNASKLDVIIATVLYPNDTTAPIQPTLVICSIFFFFFFVSVARFAHTAHDLGIFGNFEPYIATLAVLSFAIIRNFHGGLRAVYLAWPAALGAFALELSVLSNHILLSGNGTGRLRLSSGYNSPKGPGNFGSSVASLLFSTLQYWETISIVIVFLLVSWRAHQATEAVSTALIGRAERRKASTTAAAAGGGLSILDPGTKSCGTGDEQIELPQYGQGITLPSTTVDSNWSVVAQDARLRAAFVLGALWFINALYI